MRQVFHRWKKTTVKQMILFIEEGCAFCRCTRLQTACSMVSPSSERELISWIKS